MPIQRGSGSKQTNKSKPSSQNSKTSSKSNSKQSKNTKSKPKRRNDDEFDDGSENEELFVDGEYDFDSDVEVFDLSAMLDEPEERKKQTRRGGQNKSIQQPTKLNKKGKKDKKLEEGDEDVDSDLDIFTKDDFSSFAREKNNKNDSSEPISISHVDKTPKKVPEKTPIDPKTDNKSKKPTQNMKDDGDDADLVDFDEMIEDDDFSVEEIGTTDSDYDSDDDEPDVVAENIKKFIQSQKEAGKSNNKALQANNSSKSTKNTMKNDGSDLDDIDITDSDGDNVSETGSYEEDVDFDPSAFDFDEDMIDDEDYEDDDDMDKKYAKLMKSMGGDLKKFDIGNELSSFDALINKNTSDTSDSDMDSDDEDGKEANLGSIDDLLEKMANRGKKEQEMEGKSRKQQLLELTQVRRRKGELFATQEQIGDSSLRTGIENLNDGIKTFQQQQQQLQAQQSQQPGDLFAVKAKSAQDLDPMLQDGYKPTSSSSLSVASLLQSLRGESGNNTKKTGNDLLDSLKAPSLRNLSSKVASVEKKQQSQLVGTTMGDVAKGRLERQQFYDDRKKDISKFQGVVQHNRALQTLNLKSQQQEGKKQNLLTSKAMNANFQPTNQLEYEMESILKEVGADQTKAHSMEKDQQLLASMKDQTLEELEEATKYSRKMKLHALFEQQRAARIAKVKSRAQRKYIRAQQEKLQNKAMIGKEGGLTQEEIEQLELQYEKQRIKERALLTHKNTGQWAKRTLRMTAKDESARKVILEQLKLGQELRKKLGHKSSSVDGLGLSSDEEESDSEFDGDDEKAVLQRQIKKLEQASSSNSKSKINESIASSDGKKVKGSGILHLPFMKRAQEEQARKNDEQLAQLKKDLELAEEWDSDDDSTEKRLDKLKSQAENAKSRAEKQQIEAKIDNLKKTYGPGQNKNKISQASSARLDELQRQSMQDGDDDVKVIDQAIGGPAMVNKLSNMFGGVFDFDDDVPVSSSSSSPKETSQPSIQAQKEERDRILREMMVGEGKKLEFEKLQQQNQQQKNTKQVKDESDDFLSDDDVVSDSATSVQSQSKPSKRVKVEESTKSTNSSGSNDMEDDEMADIFGAEEADESNPWLVAGSEAGAATSKSSKATKNDKKSKSAVKLDLSTSVLIQDDKSSTVHVSVVGKGNPNDQTQKQQPKQSNQPKKFEAEDLVSLAFASAVDRDEEFAKMKMDEMEQELPQFDQADGLAGWGNWAGVTKTKRQLEREAAQRAVKRDQVQQQRDKLMEKRSDRKLNNVVLNGKADKNARKYQISTIPYPFTSIEEYQASLRVPLGREWNTAQGFGALNKPKVIVNAGQVIEAMKWNEGMKGYYKDGSVKDGANVARSSRDVDEFGAPIMWDEIKQKSKDEQKAANNKRKQPGKPNGKGWKENASNKRQKVKK